MTFTKQQENLPWLGNLCSLRSPFKTFPRPLPIHICRENLSHNLFGFFIGMLQRITDFMFPGKFKGHHCIQGHLSQEFILFHISRDFIPLRLVPMIQCAAITQPIKKNHGHYKDNKICPVLQPKVIESNRVRNLGDLAQCISNIAHHPPIRNKSR